MNDELLRRGRHLAYRRREDGQGHDAKLIEDLCDALEQASTDAGEGEAQAPHIPEWDGEIRPGNICGAARPSSSVVEFDPE